MGCINIDDHSLTIKQWIAIRFAPDSTLSVVYAVEKKNCFDRFYLKQYTIHNTQLKCENRRKLKLPFSFCLTHFTLHVVHLSGLHNITGVGQAGPVMKAGPVGCIIDLDLILLSQLKGHHVHGKIELSLGLVEVLLVKSITRNPGRVQGQHDQWIILHTVSSNVMANLLAVAGLVLVLKRKMKLRNMSLY